MEKTITFKQESFVFANSLNEYIIEPLADSHKKPII